jgi:D-amino-acid oxidase
VKALVLGSGVIGLTTAVTLAETGASVTVWAKDFPPHTTSDVSAAVWYPYKCEPFEKVRVWGAETLEELQKLAGLPDTGVRLVPGYKYFHRRMGPPWWAQHTANFRLLRQSEVPSGCRCGYAFELPVADMTWYLPYLVKRFERAGGKREKRTVQTLEEAKGEADIVVNCTGLGARELARDPEVFPIRGQVLRVPKLSRDEIVMDDDHEDGMIYVIPRLNETILGGIAEDGNESLLPDTEASEAIRRRCAHYFPELLDSKEEIVSVGLRPGRSSLRLEREGDVIHCYGHGGSGLSLSWGSARAIASLTQG